MNMMIIASIVILAIVLIVAYKGLNPKKPTDSALRQRAIFNALEHMTFIRLKEILPEANILAHVSFDALLTTKFPRTRRKYEKLFADFVVLDKDCRVIAIITLGDAVTTRRSNSSIDEDALLDAAGYRIIRYYQVPEYQQLREDFLVEYTKMQDVELRDDDLPLGKFDYYAEQHLARTRIYG